MVTRICSRPCPDIEHQRSDLNALRAHLMGGYQCVEGWLALSELVKTPIQRKDCLERAAVLAPEDQQIQITYLESVLEVEPENQQARKRLQELKILGALRTSTQSVLTRQQQPRPLGDILIELGMVSHEAIAVTLNRQRTTGAVRTRKLGDMLLESKLLTPQQLAHALIVQQQERSQLRAAPQGLGEYLVQAGYISPQDLEHVLIEQIRLDHLGRRLMLGELLVHLHYITKANLKKALYEYESGFWDRFYSRG